MSLCILDNVRDHCIPWTTPNVLDIIPYSCQRELRSVSFLGRISILTSDWAGTAVRTAQAVQANHKEPCDVKGSSPSAHQRTPPVTDIRAASQRMAYNHSIVPVGRELSTYAVGNWHIAERYTGFKNEGRDECNVLIRYKGRIRVLRLLGDSLYGI